MVKLVKSYLDVNTSREVKDSIFNQQKKTSKERLPKKNRFTGIKFKMECKPLTSV